MSLQPIGQVAAKIVDRWAWWQTALKDPTQIGKTLLAAESDPQQGYYRCRLKDGQWEPVAIFYPEGSDQIVGYRNGKEVRDVNALWVWCLRNPITFDAYEKAMAGDGFDDEPAKARGIGDNSGDADPYDALKIEYLGEKEQAEELLRKGIKTQADLDRASILKDRMLKIRSRAEALFKAEKQPVLDEGRRIDDKWRGLAHKTDSEPTGMAEKLRLGMETLLMEQKRAEEERQRKAKEEAERVRREAEEAAARARAIDDEQNAVEREAARQAAKEAEARAREAEREAEARKVTAGRTGARTGIRIEKKGEIVDYDAFVMAVRSRDEVRELMQSLANRAAKSGFQVDGMKIVEVEKVV